MIRYNYEHAHLEALKIAASVAQLRIIIDHNKNILDMDYYLRCKELLSKMDDYYNTLQNSPIMDQIDWKACWVFLSQYINKYKRKFPEADGIK